MNPLLSVTLPPPPPHDRKTRAKGNPKKHITIWQYYTDFISCRLRPVGTEFDLLYGECLSETSRFSHDFRILLGTRPGATNTDAILVVLDGKIKEDLMKARNCCKTMEMELTGWKAIVYGITRKMEALPGGEKEKIRPNIEDLHILIAEMDDRIDQIRENCTPEMGMADIQAEREAFNAAISSLRVTTDEAMRGLGGGNFGG
jgi:hypothetical protein